MECFFPSFSGSHYNYIPYKSLILIREIFSWTSEHTSTELQNEVGNLSGIIHGRIQGFQMGGGGGRLCARNAHHERDARSPDWGPDLGFKMPFHAI